MRLKLLPIALASLLGFTTAAHATFLQITPSTTTPVTGNFQAEPGQSMPTGTGGFVGGLLTTDASAITLVYGGPLGGTGHGDSSNFNEVWFGTNQNAAELAGNYFSTQSGIDPITGNPLTASTVGKTVTIGMTAGAVPFQFVYDILGATGSPAPHTLNNGQRDDGNGAYLVNASLSQSPDAGPSSMAFVGLSDNPFPADKDFQDLTFTAAVPEPASLALLGLGLAGIGFAKRRRTTSAVA